MLIFPATNVVFATSQVLLSHNWPNHSGKQPEVFAVFQDWGFGVEGSGNK